MLQAKTVRNVLPIIACGVLSLVVAYAGATTFMQAFLDPTPHDSVQTSPAHPEEQLHGVARQQENKDVVSREELMKLLEELANSSEGTQGH